jgi:hypothetical protein
MIQLLVKAFSLRFELQVTIISYLFYGAVFLTSGLTNWTNAPFYLFMTVLQYINFRKIFSSMYAMEDGTFRNLVSDKYEVRL